MAFWILLIHFIINFTLGAPVAVGDIHRVHANVVNVAKDGIAVLQKRMDPDGGSSSDLTSDHGLGAPGPEPESSEPEPESESESESESELESDSDSDDSDGGEAAQQWEEEFQNYEPSDIEEEDEEEGNHDSEEDNHAVDDSEVDDNAQSPPHGPESQYPAAATDEDLWRNLLKGSLRPRASTFGGVDAPKRELHETDDTMAYVSYSILPLLPASKPPESKIF